MFGDLLVDENGEVWATQSSDWRFRLGFGDTFAPLSDYAIKNLGYVRIISHPERVIVSMRPSVVQGPTVAGLFYYLSDFNFRSIALQHFDDTADEWRSRVLRANESPISQIVSLMEDTHSIVGRSSYLTKEVSFATLASRSPLHDSMSYYRATGGRLKVSQIPKFSNIFERRHMLYKISEEDGGVVLISIGGNFPKRIQDFLYSAIGNDMRDRPDPLYGAECAKAYLMVARTGRPGCFEVDTISKWTPRDELIRRRYRRVIFPFSDETGQKWVLGQSSADHTVDLRSLAS
jgi:hypothetical protein